MSVTVASEAVRSLRGLVRDNEDATDFVLLRQFIERRDEAAFALLMRRHGPMVFGVCRRIVMNDQDAEDAFQATFLVLVKKACSISPRGSVGSWLHGVARRAAMISRRTIARRRERVGEVPERPTRAADPLGELKSALDDELSRLPDIYRSVIVLCDLEGRTRQEAAALLGRPEGTVAGRLARARELLAKRLQRFTPAVALAAVMAEAASARPPLLARPATDTAAALARETLNAMGRGLIMKFASIAILVIGCAGFGVFLQAGQRGTESVINTEPPAAEAKAADSDEPIIWGREVDGLQAGIASVPANARTHHHGETAKFEIKLRNVGKADITFTYGLLLESWPRLTYLNGERVFVTMPPHVAPIVIPTEQTLKPGETIKLFNPEIAVEAADTKGDIVRTPTIRVDSWKLKLTYEGMIQSHPKLATGVLEFEVKEKPIPDESFSWGREVDGVQAGIVFGDKKTIVSGEQIKPKVRIRNAVKKAVEYTHFAGLFHFASPTVRDAKGRSITVGPPPDFFSLPVEKKGTLQPGHSVDFSGAVIELNPGKGIRNFHHIVDVPPGKYTISIAKFLNSHHELATGFAGFEVTEKTGVGAKTLEGKWIAVRAMYNGQPTPSKGKVELTATFESERFVLKDGEVGYAARYMIAEDKTPALIDIIPSSGAEKDKTFKGIVRLDGDTLTLCTREPGGDRPTAFKSEAGDKTTLIEFKREPKAETPPK